MNWISNPQRKILDNVRKGRASHYTVLQVKIDSTAKQTAHTSESSLACQGPELAEQDSNLLAAARAAITSIHVDRHMAHLRSERSSSIPHAQDGTPETLRAKMHHQIGPKCPCRCRC